MTIFARKAEMVKVISKLVSVVFHPLFIITYVTLFLFMADPYSFGVNSVETQIPFILMIFFTTAVIPMIAVLLMKFLGLVQSFELKDAKERIGPYIITGIFYIWLAVNLVNDTEVPAIYTVFVLGSAIGLFLSFFVNNFVKISAHAVGMGGLMGFFLLMMQESGDAFWIGLGSSQAIGIPFVYLFILSVLLTGLVCNSRLVLKAHQTKEVLQGVLVGLSSMFFAMIFIQM